MDGMHSSSNLFLGEKCVIDMNELKVLYLK